MLHLTQQGPDVLLSIKVVPKASRDRIIGELDGALKVAVSAAPEKGAANTAVCKLLAKALNVRTQQVSVDAGHANPRKTVRLSALRLADVQAALARICK
jgi:uncharacterized protein (TIGR00251 family)